jgi:glycosyltransferase involved in cell wall biosynthesis
MDEGAVEDRYDGGARVSQVVVDLFALPESTAPDKALLGAFGRLLREEGSDGLQEKVARYIGLDKPSLRSSVRFLEFAAGGGHTIAGLRLADLLIEHFERDEALIDFRLRFLLGLGLSDELVAECAIVLGEEIKSIHLAFRVLVSIDRVAHGGDRDVSAHYRRALSVFASVAAASREETLWWARYYREIGNATASLRSYRALIEQTAPESRYRPAALRESAELALSGDRWGRDAPFLLQAAEAGVALKTPWRARAAAVALGHGLGAAALGPFARLPGTTNYSHVHDAVGSPESAFDYLIDEILPGRVAYEPRDTLLMIGTSLAAGGMERIFANSYRAVKASGAFERVTMALLKFEFPGPTAFYLPDTGADAGEIALLYSLEVPDMPVSMLPFGLARRVWHAYRHIQQERPRVIHAWNDLPGIVAAFAGLLAGCPRIFVHFHHMRAINLSRDRNLIRAYPSCYRRLLERDEIELLFVADASAEDYADWWSVDRSDKFKRLYNGFTDMAATPGARETLRRDMGIAPDAPVLGTVFRFDRVKQPWLWIDAAERVAERLPEASFIMVGGGAEWESARARVESHGLSDRFHFPGQVRNVADYLACLDVFMLTSRVEGLPNSLVEAQLAGVPVISTDVGGARETFIPGVTGRLVDVQSPEALAEAAIECLTNRAWRDHASVKSRQMATRRFGIDRYLSSLIALYGTG